MISWILNLFALSNQIICHKIRILLKCTIHPNSPYLGVGDKIPKHITKYSRHFYYICLRALKPQSFKTLRGRGAGPFGHPIYVYAFVDIVKTYGQNECFAVRWQSEQNRSAMFNYFLTFPPILGNRWSSVQFYTNVISSCTHKTAILLVLY